MRKTFNVQSQLEESCSRMQGKFKGILPLPKIILYKDIARWPCERNALTTEVYFNFVNVAKHTIVLQFQFSLQEFKVKLYSYNNVQFSLKHKTRCVNSARLYLLELRKILYCPLSLKAWNMAWSPATIICYGFLELYMLKLSIQIDVQNFPPR